MPVTFWGVRQHREHIQAPGTGRKGFAMRRALGRSLPCPLPVWESLLVEPSLGVVMWLAPRAASPPRRQTVASTPRQSADDTAATCCVAATDMPPLASTRASRHTTTPEQD